MTFKKFARVALIALAVFAALSLILSFIDQSSAQTPPPATPPEPEPPTPACDAKMQINCSPNSGDTAWMLTAMALVLMMTIPGLGLFYGGMVRRKNVGDTIMTSFAITCLISLLWLVCTYSLA